MIMITSLVTEEKDRKEETKAGFLLVFALLMSAASLHSSEIALARVAAEGSCDGCLTLWLVGVIKKCVPYEHFHAAMTKSRGMPGSGSLFNLGDEITLHDLKRHNAFMTEVISKEPLGHGKGGQATLVGGGHS